MSTYSGVSRFSRTLDIDSRILGSIVTATTSCKVTVQGVKTKHRVFLRTIFRTSNRSRRWMCAHSQSEARCHETETMPLAQAGLEYEVRVIPKEPPSPRGSTKQAIARPCCDMNKEGPKVSYYIVFRLHDKNLSEQLTHDPSFRIDSPILQLHYSHIFLLPCSLSLSVCLCVCLPLRVIMLPANVRRSLPTFVRRPQMRTHPQKSWVEK